MKLNIGLSEAQCDGVVAILNTLLSDEYLLYTKTRNYHWNVVGPRFNDLIDLETCADKYHDLGTNDFLTGLMEKHEKMAWMLRAFVEEKPL
jgi:DNA-binding ferritin-like protein